MVACALLFSASLPVIQAEPLPVADLKRTETVDFGREIFPFLKQNCLACHNTTKAKAGLNLETPDLMKKGGDTGPAVEPGKGATSLLFTTAAHIEDPTMPPEKNTSKARNLTPDELALLKLWIDQGAKGGAVMAPAPEKWQRIDGTQPVYTASVTQDGRFAAAGRGNQITIYDLVLNKPAATLVDPALDDKATYPTGAAHRDHVQALSFSPQGDLASGGYRIAKIWRRAQATAEPALALPAEAISQAQAADGTHAFGAADGTIMVLGPAADAKPTTVKDHGGPVTGLAFSADGKTLYSASADKTLRRRSVADGRKVRNSIYHPPPTIWPCSKATGWPSPERTTSSVFAPWAPSMPPSLPRLRLSAAPPAAPTPAPAPAPPALRGSGRLLPLPDPALLRLLGSARPVAPAAAPAPAAVAATPPASPPCGCSCGCSCGSPGGSSRGGRRPGSPPPSP
ncbi:MAG: c-type cytochrome domain-containing protein [Verrucomicrobiales bacterium]